MYIIEKLETLKKNRVIQSVKLCFISIWYQVTCMTIIMLLGVKEISIGCDAMQKY